MKLFRSRDRYKPEDPAETERSEALKRIKVPSGPAPTAMIGCGFRCYEPGVTHEHRCLASSPHAGLDHTCECGKVWPGVVELQPDPWISETVPRP